MSDCPHSMLTGYCTLDCLFTMLNGYCLHMMLTVYCTLDCLFTMLKIKKGRAACIDEVLAERLAVAKQVRIWWTPA